MDEKKTQCECCDMNYGMCDRHKIFKTQRQTTLCQNSEKCFQLFEDKKGQQLNNDDLVILCEEWGNLSGEDVSQEIETLKNMDEVLAKGREVYKEEQEKEEVLQQQPGLAKKAWNFAKAVTRYTASGGKHVSEEMYQRRLAECDSCVFREKDRCLHRKCGCKLSVKAQWKTEGCPIGRWPKGDE